MTIEDNDKLQNSLYNYWNEKGDSGTQDEAIYLYANQRVIEELYSLTDIRSSETGAMAISIHAASLIVYERIMSRIKKLENKLKQ